MYPALHIFSCKHCYVVLMKIQYYYVAQGMELDFKPFSPGGSWLTFSQALDPSCGIVPHMTFDRTNCGVRA